jgi:ssDNA thymidine ADP-ribosyltransferase, DarT
MERAELSELGYIVPIDTVPSILDRGILSHTRAKKVPHQDIALGNVQDLRANVVVPNGRALHAYANLYICPRNPMLLKRTPLHEQLCVLRVQAGVIDLPGAVITNSNAASKYARFMPAPAGLDIVDRDRTFADWWTHPGDEIEQWRHSAQKCAEVLVPDVVARRYIFGAYVSCPQSLHLLNSVAPELPATVNAHMFFKRGAA